MLILGTSRWLANKIALSPVIRDEDKIPLISLAVRDEERD